MVELLSVDLVCSYGVVVRCPQTPILVETGNCKAVMALCTVTLTDDFGIDDFLTLCFYTLPFWHLAGKYVI